MVLDFFLYLFIGITILISSKLNFEIPIFCLNVIVDNNINNTIEIDIFSHLLILASSKIFSTKFSNLIPV